MRSCKAFGNSAQPLPPACKQKCCHSWPRMRVATDTGSATATSGVAGESSAPCTFASCVSRAAQPCKSL
eukprot:3110411-Alexandrium_andersonii.AAC.1